MLFTAPAVSACSGNLPCMMSAAPLPVDELSPALVPYLSLLGAAADLAVGQNAAHGGQHQPARSPHRRRQATSSAASSDDMPGRMAGAGMVSGPTAPSLMVMRYRRAIEKLRVLAEACESVKNWPLEDPFLLEAYVFGAVLEGADPLESVEVALVINLPPEEVPWE